MVPAGLARCYPPAPAHTVSSLEQGSSFHPVIAPLLGDNGKTIQTVIISPKK